MIDMNWRNQDKPLYQDGSNHDTSGSPFISVVTPAQIADNHHSLCARDYSDEATLAELRKKLATATLTKIRAEAKINQLEQLIAQLEQSTPR